MKLYKLLKDEYGGVLPIVALLLAFVLIGLSALVIDAGYLYAERRSLVTAADAAALGGAKVLEEKLSNTSLDPEDIRADATEVAEALAKANGVKNPGDINVNVVYRGDPDFAQYGREVIHVEIKNNYTLFFANFLGINTTDVAAEATASWGFTTKVEGGDILPIFTKASDYQSVDNTYLHAGKFVDSSGDVLNGNWGLIDISGNTNDISEAFSGEHIGLRMEIDYYINNQSGLNVGGVNNPIEQRMITANTLADKSERIRYMTGLVPVIDWNNITVQGSQLKLPIDCFAVFEIYDVIIHESNNDIQKSKGSPYALYDTADYKSDGIAHEYDKVDGSNLEKSSIIGRFTGVTVDIQAVMMPGDQTNPNPGVITPTWSKLIE